MGQSDRLKQMDARLTRAFLRSGLADSAVFKRCGSAATTNCTVMVDDTSQLQGDLSQVTQPSIVVTAFVADIGPTQPVTGDKFTIGNRVLVVDSIVDQDASRFVLSVIEDT